MVTSMPGDTRRTPHTPKHRAPRALTPPEMLIERTIFDLHGNASMPRTLVSVYGTHEGEPATVSTIAGHLPSLILPVVTTLENGERASADTVIIAARSLAARFYGVTRTSINPFALVVRFVEGHVPPDDWYAARCPESGVTVLVRPTQGSPQEARQLVEALYRQDAPDAGFARIKGSVHIRHVTLY